MEDSVTDLYGFMKVLGDAVNILGKLSGYSPPSNRTHWLFNEAVQRIVRREKLLTDMFGPRYRTTKRSRRPRRG